MKSAFNVVEADGRRLALVIANSQRLPGPILRGEDRLTFTLDKSLSAGRTDSAGMIFVDPGMPRHLLRVPVRPARASTDPARYYVPG